MKKRKVCVVTGSRSEFGLLTPLLKEIEKDKDLTFQLLVTGMHLSREFGNTYKEIEEEGFTIDKKIDVDLVSDDPIAINKSIAKGIVEFSKAYERLKPDVVIVSGDRSEILSAVVPALFHKITIGHIHGGEATFGSLDESIRHVITKMSHLHFTSCEEYRKRIIQLGEDPSKVFNFGAISLDNIKKIKLFKKKELEKKLNFSFGKKNLLITFHPESFSSSDVSKQFNIILKVLGELKDTFLIFTKTNSDFGGRVINKMIDDFVSKNKDKSISFISLGRIFYLSALQFVDAVIGNSSSGIIEAPSFKIPTVNIGDRQEGRIRIVSTIDCPISEEYIRKAINKTYIENFRDTVKKCINPYQGKDTARKIKNVIKNYDLSNILKKKFYDL